MGIRCTAVDVVYESERHLKGHEDSRATSKAYIHIFLDPETVPVRENDYRMALWLETSLHLWELRQHVGKTLRQQARRVAGKTPHPLCAATQRRQRSWSVRDCDRKKGTH